MTDATEDIDPKFGALLIREDPVARERRVRRNFWQTLRRAGRRIPFAEDVVAAYYCAVDRKTPTRVRATLLAALAYFVLPVDIVPDFIAAFGFTDDATVLLATVGLVRGHINDDHRAAAKRALADDAPPTV